MTEVILDEPNKRNKIGQSISSDIEKGVKSLYLVSPFISDIQKYLTLEKVKDIKIICNAESPSCNPHTLLELTKQNKIKIKSRNDIHAKIFLLDDVAYISSSNATPNGLGEGNIEAASKLTDIRSIKEIKSWFNNLWKDSLSNNIEDYDDVKWQQLIANWNIRNTKNNTKVKLYDLLVTNSIPNNTSFAFWYDSDPNLSKITVSKQAKIDGIRGLPNDFGNWDYFIDDEIELDNTDSYKSLSSLLPKYYDKYIVNIKTNRSSTKFYHKDNFISKLLDKPVEISTTNEKLLLTLFRKDIVFNDIIIDSKSIKLLNKSRIQNKGIWEEYLSSNDGIYGYCTSTQLYKLVKDCYLNDNFPLTI